MTGSPYVILTVLFFLWLSDLREREGDRLLLRPGGLMHRYYHTLLGFLREGNTTAKSHAHLLSRPPGAERFRRGTDLRIHICKANTQWVVVGLAL